MKKIFSLIISLIIVFSPFVPASKGRALETDKFDKVEQAILNAWENREEELNLQN